MSNQFTCDMCGETFDAGCDDDARDELNRTFGSDVRPEDCGKVCDACYKIVT